MKKLNDFLSQYSDYFNINKIIPIASLNNNKDFLDDIHSNEKVFGIKNLEKPKDLKDELISIAEKNNYTGIARINYYCFRWGPLTANGKKIKTIKRVKNCISWDWVMFRDMNHFIEILKEKHNIRIERIINHIKAKQISDYYNILVYELEEKTHILKNNESILITKDNIDIVFADIFINKEV